MHLQRCLIVCFFLLNVTFARELVFAQDSAVGAPSSEEVVSEFEGDALDQREPAATKRRQRAQRNRSGAPRKTQKPALVRMEEVSGTLSEISIEGNKKIEAPAILAKISLKPGQSLNRKSIRTDVESIFKMGFFNDVQVDRSGPLEKTKLIFKVVEKPAIVEIVVDGSDEVKKEDIDEASGIKPFEILDMVKIRTAIEKIQKLYEDKGYFLAKVDAKVEEIPEKEGSVRLRFVIKENDMVRVKRVRFLGNDKLVDGKLKTVMATQEGGFFSFISSSGSYKQDAFERDLINLNYLYYNEGFIQVKIDRPQVYVTPDKKGIYVTIRIDEGERFNIGEIDFSGDLLFTADELNESVQIKKGEQFNYSKLQEDLGALTAKYGDLGYAYANVIPRNRIREKERIVDISFEVDKGNKVYIGKINVKGNSKTRDKVVRRELKLREGELYHETRRRESLANVKRLGFFEDVNFNTLTPQDQPDKMDIDIVVKERNTGSIQVGAGYSSFSKFVFNGQVNQANFLGKGHRLGASVQYNRVESLFNLNFTEPYFADSLWEVGFDAYRTSREREEFKEVKTGGAMNLGHPLAPYLQGGISYKLDKTKLDLGEEGDPQLFPAETVNGYTSSVTLSLMYDKRNDRFEPTKGLFSRLAVEYAGVGGDLSYTKGTATLRYYQKIFWDLVWRNNLNYGFISSNGGAEPPFNELFLLGGAHTLRGYDWFSVGKRKFSKTAADRDLQAGVEPADVRGFRPFGGSQQVYYNLEFQFNLIQEAQIRGVVFYDIGYADDALKLSDFRANYGFGFRWFSPIGPLRFEWGFPINPQDKWKERDVNFQFSIGSPF